MATPVQLRAMVDDLVNKQQEWNEALVLEKLGFNWDEISYGTSGVKAVIFQQPYASGVTDIDIRIKVFDAEGYDIGGSVSNITNTGFDLTVDSACTFNYIAFEPKVLVPL